MLDVEEFVSTHVGREAEGSVFHRLRRAWTEDECGGLPSNWLSMLEGAIPLGLVSPIDYIAGLYTETKDGGGTIGAGATGIELASANPSADNDDQVISGKRRALLVEDMVLFFGMRVYLSSAANTGLQGGLVTGGSTELFTANPADGILITKAKNAATPVVGRVVENGNAADDQNINQATDLTDLTMGDDVANSVRLGFCAKPGGSNEDSWGFFYCAKSAGSILKAVATSFDANQIDALRKMLATTAASLQFHLATRANGAAAQRTLGCDYAFGFAERL